MQAKDISTLSRDELAEYGAAKIGFIFRFYNLIPTLTVEEIATDALETDKVLEEVGLGDHMKKFPSHLSGGRYCNP